MLNIACCRRPDCAVAAGPEEPAVAAAGHPDRGDLVGRSRQRWRWQRTGSVSVAVRGTAAVVVAYQDTGAAACRTFLAVAVAEGACPSSAAGPDTWGAVEGGNRPPSMGCRTFLAAAAAAEGGQSSAAAAGRDTCPAEGSSLEVAEVLHPGKELAPSAV